MIDVRIKSIAAGAHHAAAIDENGALYMWGARLWLEPHRLTVLEDQKIVAVACGLDFTAAISGMLPCNLFVDKDRMMN